MTIELRSAAAISQNGGVEKRLSAGPAVVFRDRPPLASTGFSGINRFRGMVAEEYVPELRGVQAVDVYTKMESDGLVSGLLTALELPVRAASWTVEPSGNDANAKRAAELVEDQLFNRLGECWESVVECLLSYLQFGYHVSAKQWGVVNGEVVLTELRDLHPRTLVQGKGWDFDPEGRLIGVWQYGNAGDKFTDAYIPDHAMLHLVNRGRFGNPEGRSVLRSCYKHWLIKDMLYRVDAIGKERGGVGTPVGTYPEGASTNDQDRLEEFCKYVQVSENGYLIGPEGMKVENFAVETSTEGIMASVQHHNTMLATSLLAQWLSLGQEGSGGAYSLSADLTDLFLLCLETVGDYVAARVNRKIIPEMVSYNIATDQFPKVSATISRRSASALAALIRPLTAGQNPPLYWQDADEDWLREQLQLPPKTEARPKPQEVIPPKPGEKTPPEKPFSIIFADPPQFGSEKPAYSELGKVIGEFGDALRGLGDKLRAEVWDAVGLPEVEAPQAHSQTYKSLLQWGKEQIAAVDAAIGRFLRELRGEAWVAETFLGTESEDALLQGFLRIGHATGVTHAATGLGATVTSDLKRTAPAVQALLSDAFTRLSKDGEVRLASQLAEIKDILSAGVKSAENPLVTARTLAARFDKYSRYEFERLARTEMAHAANTGSLQEYAGQGIRSYEWIGDPSCAVCASFFGRSYPVGNGPVPPMDSHPSCMCGVAGVVSE